MDATTPQPQAQGLAAPAPAQAGSLSWRLSSHPITLLTFLAFRICKRLSQYVRVVGRVDDQGACAVEGYEVTLLFFLGND
jgi:hypothetical protein